MTDRIALRSGTTRLDVTFIGRDQPALGADTYTLTADQPIVVDGDQQPTESLHDAVEFTVDSPRFTLPPDAVEAVHPPPTAVGRFDITLPHAVLTGHILPWARRDDAHPERPWLALLLVTDDDVATDPGTGEAVRSATVGDLLKPPEHVLGPDLDAATVADPGKTPCRIVDVHSDVLDALLPDVADLPWLVHVRDVTVKTLKKTRDATDDFTPGRRSVIAANRFPRLPSRRYTAVLVSLEGHFGYSYLGGGKAAPAGTTAVRMAALWSWSFTTAAAEGDPANSNFQALAAKLAEASRKEDALCLPHQADASDTGVKRHVAEQLAAGYVPVVHRPATGEHTPAWYRGPWTAHHAQPLPDGRLPLKDAQSGLVYLEDFGIWDVSYACAYTLGQVLAAADPKLLKALAAFRADGLAVVQAAGPADHRDDVKTPDSARTRLEKLLGDAALAPSITQGLKTEAKNDTETATKNAPKASKPATLRPEPPRVGAGGHTLAVAALIAGADEAVPLAAALDAVAADHVVRVSEALGPGVQWLLRVPFDHLVPHAGMLPEHTARFFQVDRQWMNALFTGMRSLGTATTLDRHLDLLLDRAHLRAKDPDLPVFGVLIRSPLVRYWPELVVEAKHDGKPLATWVGRPLPDTMLLLWDSRPDSLVLREPPHGLSLGIDTLVPEALNLRKPDGGDMGTSLGQTAQGIEKCRRGTDGVRGEVVCVAAKRGGATTTLKDIVQAALTANGHGTPALTAAGLALQLLNSAGSLTFAADVSPADPAPPSPGTASAGPDPAKDGSA
ncbi:hypothetical protein [Embleya sp. NPDC020630]|uniref:hypothetical protein n=1 Tax=Embleya sp. NPDC020630 TaxID=3363979 RepID=UPI00378FA7A0